jgi:hypothetical protein
MTPPGRQDEPRPRGTPQKGRRPADDLLAAGVAAGLSVQAAARKAGVSERTARRRMAEDGFRERVAELRQEVVRQSLGLAAEGLVDGLVTLRQLCRQAEGDGVRLGAARSLVEIGLQFVQLEDVQARLAALEEARQAGDEKKGGRRR